MVDSWAIFHITLESSIRISVSMSSVILKSDLGGIDVLVFTQQEMIGQ